jgi:putative membrane protein
MKAIAISAAAALCLMSPALAPPALSKTAHSAMSAAPGTADFVTKVAISDMFEIQASQLAAQRADDATKNFAQQMIADHQKTSAELKDMVQSKKVTAVIPADMDSAHKKMLDKLNGLNGAAFNKEYHKEQVSAHKEAASLFKRYAQAGKDAPLKDWAGQTEPTLEHHLQMAQDLNK